MEKREYTTAVLSLLLAGAACFPAAAAAGDPNLYAEAAEAAGAAAGADPAPAAANPADEAADEAADEPAAARGADEALAGAPARRPKADYAATEKDLAGQADEEAAVGGQEALIETSRPYLLPRLFTLPTAYSLQSYELRFGGQGNIHSTMANLDNEAIKVSASLGLAGIVELGYQLDEYYTVENISDKILMGYFKLTLMKEGKYLPAASISASKNLRTGFHAPGDFDYSMDEDLYEVVLSKAFRIGGNVVSVHPGVQVIRDEVTKVEGADLAEPYHATKVNPRLGLSWQTRPKTLFMYELKVLSPTVVASLADAGIETHRALENNLGIRYYIRNWLCIDSGIRHYYDTDNGEDEMKLHANFVGVIPLAVVYDRISNYFKK